MNKRGFSGPPSENAFFITNIIKIDLYKYNKIVRVTRYNILYVKTSCKSNIILAIVPLY